MLTISVVTPSFNQGQFLEQTIDSVLSQGYPRLEYVIIDGGSTDGSVEIIRRYQKYLHYWCSEPDHGQYAAINKGFTHTTGEIMAWLNSDDFYLPWTFDTVTSIMSAFPTVHWLCSLQPAWCDYYGLDVEASNQQGFSLEAMLDGRSLPGSCTSPFGFIQQESVFWRRSLWEKAGGQLREDRRYAADYELWSRFFQCADLYGIRSPLAVFRHRSGQRSEVDGAYFAEAQQCLEEARRLQQWKPKLLRELLYKLRVNKVPLLRRWCAAAGYTGKLVYRRARNTPEAEWSIKTYNFL